MSEAVIAAVGLMLSEMMHERFSADLVGAAKGSCEAMIRREGQMETGIIFFVNDKEAGFIHFPQYAPDSPEAPALVEFIRGLLKDHRAHSYAKCAEVWYRVGGNKMLQDGRSAGQYPDRKEAVALVGEAGGRPVAHVFEMLRDEAGNFLGLGDDIVAQEGGKFTAFGLWTDLLGSEVRH